MTLPASGAIFMSQINVELGRASAASDSLNDSWVRALANKPSGAISFNDLHGTTARFDGTLATATVSNFNKVSFSSAPFFGSTLNQLQLNNSTLEVFLSFGGGGGPNWSGNIKIINNTTGFAVVLSKQDSVDWYSNAGSANLIRTGATADSFTVLPSN